MNEPTPIIKVQFNEDDEIIARIDECERLKAECPNKDCPFVKLLDRRKSDLKKALVDHWLFGVL